MAANMTKPTPKSRAIEKLLRSSMITLSIALGAACGSSAPAPPAPVSDDTYAVVNGQTITREDVDKGYRRAQPSGQPALSEEETLGAKLGVLDDMIVENLLMAKAAELKIEAVEKDVDEAYNATKRNMTDAQLQEELTRRQITVADVRDGLRRELVARKVLEREVLDKVAVTDAEITAFFDANRAQFNLTEDAYRLAQIVVTPVQDQQPSAAGDDATTPQQAEVKIAGLMRRLQEGTPFGELARDHSEDPETAPRGGDLGLVPVTALQRINPALRDAVLKAKPGSATPVNAGGIHTIVLVIGLEKAGQRDLTMQPVKDSISANIRDRKVQLRRAAYLTALKTDAKVENYFARRLALPEGK